MARKLIGWGRFSEEKWFEDIKLGFGLDLIASSALVGDFPTWRKTRFAGMIVLK